MKLISHSVHIHPAPFITKRCIPDKCSTFQFVSITTHTWSSTNCCLHFEAGFMCSLSPAAHSPCHSLLATQSWWVLPVWLGEYRLGQEGLCERVVVGGLAPRVEVLPRTSLLLALDVMDGGHRAVYSSGLRKGSWKMILLHMRLSWLTLTNSKHTHPALARGYWTLLL